VLALIRRIPIMRIHRHGGLLTKKQNDELVESSKTEF